MEHTGFIVAAFGITALIVGILIVTVVLDHRNLERALSKFPRRDSEADSA